MKRIADPRIASVEEADRLMAEIAKIETTIELEAARANSKVSTIKRNLSFRLCDLQDELSPKVSALKQFIAANPQLFVKPKKRKCDAGEYGVQSATEVVITDPDALLERLMDLGYNEVIKTVRTPIKTKLKEHMQAGEEFPGCWLKSGDTFVYKVSPDLLSDAKRRGEEE